MSSAQSAVTEAEWEAERRRTRRVASFSSAVGFVFTPSLAFPALLLGNFTSTGDARYPVTVGWMALIFVPFTFLIVRANNRQRERSDDIVSALARQSAEAADAANAVVAFQEIRTERQEFGRRLGNALDMAETETDVMNVMERSFRSALPESPVELLLADNSRAHLLRMASASPTGEPPGCGVASPDGCPAARRAQNQFFAHSDDLDACPKLLDRPGGAVSAVCVPVSIMGRTVGVIHATGKPNKVFLQSEVEDLGTLANLVGGRIGLLRVMADTQLQAATDGLTGLLNRRSFEQKLTLDRLATPDTAFAMADLDHFKMLNDTYGHQTGDRALRLFADVLRSSLRARDLVCRHGGEEFVVAFPACTAENARRALDNMRSRLDAAITVAGLPQFTVSVGVVDAQAEEDLPSLLARADAALFAAKHDGRNRVTIHNDFGDGVPYPAGPSDFVDAR